MAECLRALVLRRLQAGGLTFFAPSEERLESGLYSKTYLENQLAVALGGRVAEEIIFGEDDVTTGASSDFMQARAPACSGVQCIRSKTLGPGFYDAQAVSCCRI